MTPEKENDLLIDVRGAVVWVTMNRPHRANAFTGAMVDALASCWRQLQDDPDVRVIVLTGAGDRHFSAGGDVASIERGEFRSEGLDDPLTYSPRHAGITKPVIAAVNGHAVGGGLAFVTDADIVLAVEGAEFSDPHVSLGLMCGYASGRLTTLVPLGEAVRLAVGGSAVSISADRAHQLGLVQEVLPDIAALNARADELASAIANFSSEAVEGSLAFVRRMASEEPDVVLRDALRRARTHFDHHDAVGGIEAARSMHARRPSHDPPR